MTILSARIIKGGALIQDSRRLVEVWDPELESGANIQRIAEQNLLAKRSRSRTDDLIEYALTPRFVAPGPHVIPALKGLLAAPTSFAEACYYEASRHDGLLAACAEEAVWEWYQKGRTLVHTDDVSGWLARLAADGRTRRWSDRVRRRVAHGLLATLRDFGVLEGAANKRIAVPSMTPTGFGYVAFREREQGRSSRALVDSTVWRRWLLDTVRVEDLFGQAERLGVLRLSQVGSAVRIDWKVDSLAEVTRVAA